MTWGELCLCLEIELSGEGSMIRKLTHMLICAANYRWSHDSVKTNLVVSEDETPTAKHQQIADQCDADNF